MEEQSKALTVFNFEEQEIRTVIIDGKIWFVAADVCNALGIKNVSLAVNGRSDRGDDGLDEDEKGIAIVNTLNGPQQMLCVNESGLQELIWKSRKPKAKAFKRWIKREVVPAIASTGVYDPAGRLAELEQEVLQLRQREQKLLPERVTNEQAYEVIGTVGTMVQGKELFPEMDGVDRFNLEFALHKVQAQMKGGQYQYFSTKGKDAGRIKEYPDETEEEEASRQRREKAIRDREKNKAPEVIEREIVSYLEDFGTGDVYAFEAIVEAHRHLIEEALKKLEKAGTIKKFTQGKNPFYELVESGGRIDPERLEDEEE